ENDWAPDIELQLNPIPIQLLGQIANQVSVQAQMKAQKQMEREKAAAAAAQNEDQGQAPGKDGAEQAQTEGYPATDGAQAVQPEPKQGEGRDV
ncbi:unnamed protein product, partial [Amoebophrya sp. A120]